MKTDWSRITEDEKVKELLIKRIYIEEEIKRLDENALVLYELEALSITAVSCRREQLKKFYKYLDTEAVAMNCNDKEIDEVINDFFNCN